MTNEEAIKIIKAECYVFNPLNLDRTQMVNTALDRACKALEQEATERYKPVTLRKHDAEPRRLKAILDVKTNDIYILKTTKGLAESMGITIKGRNADTESEE